MEKLQSGVEKLESGVEKLESAIDLHSARPRKDYRMRGDVGRFDDEDLYAEKERLQQKFISENPEDELSKMLQSSATICPADTPTRSGTTSGTTTSICAVEQVPAAEWRLTPLAATRLLSSGQQQKG